MKTRHLLAALAALLACAAPSLASNTGITIQIPAAVTSVAASDVTVLDVAGLYLATDVEAALAEARATYETVVDMPLPCPPTVTAYAWDDSKWYVCSAAGDAWNVITHGGTHTVGASDPITANLLESSCDIGVGLASGGPLAGQVCTTFVVPGPATTSGLTLATSRLLGRTTASTGAVEELTVSSPLSLSGGALGLGTLGVSGGGTGVTSLTAYAPVCGGTTTTAPMQSCGTGLSTTGYVLTSNGAAALPTWQAASGGGISGLGTTADKVVCTTTSDSAAKACDSSTTLPTQLTTYGADATPLIVKGNAAGSARGSLKIAGDSGDGCQFYGPSSNNSYLICPSAIQISAGANGLLLFTTRTEMGGPLYVKRPHQNSTATSGAPRALTGDTSSPGDSNSIFTNTSASAETHFNLQDAAIGNEGSYVYTFVVTDADGMQINASSGDVINNATTACATSGFIASNTIGSTITLAAVDATNWWVIAIAGTWTCDV